jgi:hypothetical protein
MPINHPIWALSQSNTWLSTKKVIKTPFIIQAAKHTVKAAVLITKILFARTASLTIDRPH